MRLEYEHTAMALTFDSAYGALQEQLVHVSWRQDAAQVLATILDLARCNCAADTATQPLHLPYLSLGTRLPISSDGWVSIDRDVGTDHLQGVEHGRPFAYAKAACLDRSAINDTLARWLDGPLARFVVKFGVSHVALDRLREALGTKGLFEFTTKSVQLFPWPAPSSAEQSYYAVAPGAVASMLAGREVFPGLGEVVRVVGTRNNDAELMTRPVSAEGGRFSLVCKVSAQTVPGAQQPIIYLSFSRRRWATALKHDFHARSVAGFVFETQTRPELAFRFELQRHYQAEWKTDGAFDEMVNSFALDPAYANEKVIHYPNSEQTQVLVEVSNTASFAAGSKLEAGVPLADQVDAFGTISALLAERGLAPFRRYARVVHKRITMPKIDVPKTEMEKTDPDYKAPVGAVTKMAHKGGVAKDGVRRRIYLLVQDREQVATIKSVIRQMVGDDVSCTALALPPAVHGCAGSLPMADAKRKSDRMLARAAAWESFAREHDFGPQPMFLVQAEEWYTFEGETKHDDGVNKVTAKRTLSRLLGATVQYIRPKEKGADSNGKKEAYYHQRLQSAILDLVYGHSGRILGLDTAVSRAFANPLLPPAAVAAIGSVAVYANDVLSKVLVAVRYGLPSCEPRVRLAHMLGEAVTTPWMRFDEALQYVASRPALKLPSGNLASGFFQRFLGEVLDDISFIDPNAVVLVDAVRTRSMWDKLTDMNACYGPQRLDGQKKAPAAWRGLRIVRVRRQAPAMANIRLREATWPDGSQLKVPTSVPTLFRVDGATAPTYWSYSKAIGHQKRGCSCYRAMSLPKDRAGQGLAIHMPDYGQHQNPRGTEFVVLQAQERDDVDAIAVFCETLRSGVPQTRGDTAVGLPSPLHAVQKLAEYMAY